MLEIDDGEVVPAIGNLNGSFNRHIEHKSAEDGLPLCEQLQRPVEALCTISGGRGTQRQHTYRQPATELHSSPLP